MAKDRYLKKENSVVIGIFIIWCIAIYIAFLSYPTGVFEKALAIFKEQNVKNSAAAMFLPILVVVLAGFISPENKARLVFWRYKYALPGHRAFSKLAPNDPRIDMQALTEKMGDSLPHSPKQQNSKWYSLYKNYAGSITVVQSQKHFLLARDLSSISFLFAAFGPLGLLFTQSFNGALIYGFVMVIHYIILAIVAQNHGKRFVCNVLAEFSNDQKAGKSTLKT